MFRESGSVGRRREQVLHVDELESGLHQEQDADGPREQPNGLHPLTPSL